MQFSKFFLFFSILLVNITWSIKPLHSQEEGEGELSRWKSYYGQRSYPFDSIPMGAYENAIAQREALRQSQGYQLAGSWASMGPMPYENIYSCRVNNIKYVNSNKIYITGESGGVWKTEDGGATWVNKSGNLPTLSAGCLTIDAQGNLYFGSGDVTIYFGEGRGMRIFKSIDDGTTWTSISNGLVPGTSISRIAISPLNPAVMFAATFHGLYKTEDGGQSWSRVIPDPSQTQARVCTDVCFSPSGNRVYAVGPSEDYFADPFHGIGYWRSIDGGNTFNPVSPSSGFPHLSNDPEHCPTGYCPYGKTILAVSQANEDFLYIMNFDDAGTRNVYVYKSVNGGSDFTVPPIGSWPSAIAHDGVMMLRASDVNANICFAGDLDLHRTLDGGQTWGYSYANHADYIAMDFNPGDPNGNQIAVGNHGGVWRSADLGGSWTSMNQNLGSLFLLTNIAASTYDPGSLASGLWDHGLAYNDGTSTHWHSAGVGGDGYLMTASPFKSKRFVGSIAGATPGGIVYYSSNGINFSQASDYRENTTYQVGYFTNHPTQPGVTYMMRDINNQFDPTYILKSTNYGVTWNGDFPVRVLTRPSNWNVQNLSYLPFSLAISPSNSNTMIMNYGNGNEWWHFNYNLKSRFIKSTNGGANWLNEQEPNGQIEAIVTGGITPNIPDRFFTHVEFDPNNENEVYLTVSGYYHPSSNEGHVFRSTNGGYNWVNINGNLPDIPVNDLIIHYQDCNTKELIVATDAGIYATNTASINWRELALDFPNTPSYNLDYNRLSGKLRAATWGRGGWEYQLDAPTDPIYVRDHLYITDYVTLNHQIIVCSGGKLTLGHADVPGGFTINFTQPSNVPGIIVEDGGHLEAPNNVPITLTSQSGTWGGIEIQGPISTAVLTNCTFNNTPTPVVIDGGPSNVPTSDYVIIQSCTFNNAPVQIINRKAVSIYYSTWNYSPGFSGVCGVEATGIDHCNFIQNTINCPASSNTKGFSVVQSGDVVFSRNTINNASVGIFCSNVSIPYIRFSNISNSDPDYAVRAIWIEQCLGGNIAYNTNITGYQKSFEIQDISSPILLLNIAENDRTAGSEIAALKCYNYASPKLEPTITPEGEIIWDAGKNTLKTINAGDGIKNVNFSVPKLYEGCNTIFGQQYYINGENLGVSEWYMTHNSWVNDPPDPNKFNVPGVNLYYDPWGCPYGQGGGLSAVKGKTEEHNPEDPPPTLIVDYGNGIVDTLRVASTNIQLSADKMMLNEGTKQTLLNNFQSAVNTFQQLIQTYHDSSTAKLALKKIFTCYQRMNADTTAYTSLRNYCLSLASSYGSDTAMVKLANEVSRKCLVKKLELTHAIDEYENVIQNSHDSLDIVPAEINVIEVYMLMQNSGGNSPSYTGKLAYLKPINFSDGMRMIFEKLHHLTSGNKQNVIPREFTLSQNYPNPFNAMTKINYALPKNANVTLKIYDILGRLVGTLVNDEFKEAGYHTVTFDGTNLASGVYFYRIDADKFIATKKMVIVK